MGAPLRYSTIRRTYKYFLVAAQKKNEGTKEDKKEGKEKIDRGMESRSISFRCYHHHRRRHRRRLAAAAPPSSCSSRGGEEGCLWVSQIPFISCSTLLLHCFSLHPFPDLENFLPFFPTLCHFFSFSFLTKKTTKSFRALAFTLTKKYILFYFCCVGCLLKLKKKEREGRKKKM